MINSQSQKGGDGSTNIQTQQMVVHVGIDEKRAREIYHEMNSQVIKDYSREALNIANARVSEFENKLLPKMEQVEGALEAFADPSFQLLLVEAQKTAASTERAEDYDLLSELLIYRFQKGENRIARAGVSLAVEILDKVSDEALLGLTVAHVLVTFTPVSGDIIQGLDTLDNLFGKVFYGNFPQGTDWLDHLDILDAVRLSPFGGLKNLQQFYSESLSGYVDIGIEKKSENYERSVEILKSNNLPSDLLIDNVLNNDFVRLCVRNRSSIDDIPLQQEMKLTEGQSIIAPFKLSEEQIKAIDSIYDLYSKDDNLRQTHIALFMNEVDKRPNLKILREWWDKIPVSFTITSVGKVLAHSNAQRCDKSLPPLA